MEMCEENCWNECLSWSIIFIELNFSWSVIYLSVSLEVCRRTHCRFQFSPRTEACYCGFLFDSLCCCSKCQVQCFKLDKGLKLSSVWMLHASDSTIIHMIASWRCCPLTTRMRTIISRIPGVIMTEPAEIRSEILAVWWKRMTLKLGISWHFNFNMAFEWIIEEIKWTPFGRR